MKHLELLIVEDMEDDAELLLRYLKKAGYEVSWERVEDAESMRALLAERDWDAVISDYSMPRFSGMEGFNVLRESGLDIPFIMISGTIGEETAVAAMRAGVSDYLMKDNLARLAPALERELADAEIRKEKRAAVAALAESEERYRIVAESASDAIVTIDQDSIIRFANPAAERIFGYSISEMIGEPITMLMPERIRSMQKAGIEQYLATGNGRLILSGTEILALKKDGTEIIINISFGEFKNENTHVFTTIIRDITEAKLAEDHLREAAQDFEGLINATTKYVWEMDERGNLAEFPKWWLDLTGQGFKESRHYSWTKFIHPEDRENVRKAYIAALKSKVQTSLVLRIYDKNARSHWFAARGVPMFKEDGTFRKWICTLSDITDRMAAEQEIRESEERFRALMLATSETVWTADMDGNSPELFAWLSELSGQHITSADDVETKILHPDDVEPARRHWIDAVENRELFEYTYRIKHLDGLYRHLLAHAYPIFNQDGTFRQWIGTLNDITESVRSQYALAESEARYRELFENANDLIFTLDLDENITSVNRAGEIVSGYSRNELLTMNLKDLAAPDYFELARSKTAEKLAGAVSTSYIAEMVTKDGSRVPMDISSRLIFDGKKPIGIQAICRDISERVAVETALRKNEAQLRLVTDTVPAMISYLDTNEICRFANRQYLNWIGKDPDSVIGNPLRDVVGKETRANVIPEFRRAFAGEEFGIERYAFHQPSGAAHGERRYLRISYIPDRSANGAVIGCFVFLIDLTESKRSEEAIRKKERQLKLVTDSMPAFIVFFDSEERLRFANKAYLDWLGKTEEEVLGLTIREIQGDESYKKIEHEIKEALSGKELTVERELSFPRQGSDEEEIRFLRVSYVPEFDSTGSVTGYYAFAIDLTDARDAEEALRRSEEQLAQAQKLESIGRLAGGIAHDFNNMLTAINGYSDLTLRRMHPEDPLRSNIEEIKKAGERSAELTGQLLAFSRRQMLQPQLVDLNGIVEDTMEMLRRLIGEDIDLSATLSSEIGSVHADPGQLGQVLVNLVVNSRDAITNGGSITIETKKVHIDRQYADAHVDTEPGTYVLLSVSDTGVGMDHETVRHVFEPFFTTKEVGKGTGLGLATVYGIVKQSGGNIIPYSEPGKGTTMKIYLPHASGGPDEIHLSNIDPDFRFGSETILLVEDEEVVRKLTSEVLGSCGYNVIEAANGMEALRLLEGDDLKIALLMTDVVMPQMGGRELAEIVAEKLPGIKILYSSGYTDNAAFRHGLIEEGTNFIAKPFTFDQLTKKVRDLLDQ
jgi:two-component system, cell cycle sensor histidine kinase and response regulator CckA